MNQSTLDARWVLVAREPRTPPAPVLFFEHKLVKKDLSMLFQGRSGVSTAKVFVM
jgi:hypothetical protein